MTDIPLAVVVVAAVVVLVLPADLVVLLGARRRPADSASSSGCPGFDANCRHDKASAECPERQGGVCDE